MVISELVVHQARIWTTLECEVCWYKKSAQLLLTWVVSVRWLSAEGVAFPHFMIVTFLHFFLLVCYSKLDAWRILDLQCVLWLHFGFFSSLKGHALPTSNKTFPATFGAFLQIVQRSPIHSAYHVAFGVLSLGRHAEVERAQEGSRESVIFRCLSMQRQPRAKELLGSWFKSGRSYWVY